MTNIEQFTRELMLAHDIDYDPAQYRAFTFYENLAQDVPSVLNDWISVDDRLPPSGKEVLTRLWGGKYRIDLLPFANEVTHWCPLPEPPKEK